MTQKDDLAFVFPGQGSQSPGMLRELAESFPEVRQVFSRASDVLKLDLWKMVREDQTGQLNQTTNTQPAMLTAGVAVWEVWNSQTSVRPGWMAGHSLGEFTALVCANSIAFEDAVALVRQRATLMQDAVPVGAGAMAVVIGLDDDVIADLCLGISGPDGIVSSVNFNSPGQVVIAGNAAAVGVAIEAAKEAGARRAMILPVSVPAHCELMRPAAEKFADHLDGVSIEAPEIPVVHNFDVASHSDPVAIRDVLMKQVYNPVRWIESVKHLHAQGVTSFVECGPGKVLCGLNKRIVRECNAFPIVDPASLEKAVEKCE